MQASLDFAKEFERLARKGLREGTTELGGVAVRLVRVEGGVEGRWDHDAGTAETAVVWSGDFSVEFRDGTVHLGPGQCCVVPMGAEHHGLARSCAEVVLFTPPAGWEPKAARDSLAKGVPVRPTGALAGSRSPPYRILACDQCLPAEIVRLR